MHGSCVSVCYALKHCMHDSLFFSKNTDVYCILEYYIHGSPSFAESSPMH